MSRKLKERAAACVAEGKLDVALDLYRQVAKDDPSEIGCLQRAAEIARTLGKNEEAVSAFRKVAERYAADGLLLKAIACVKQILAIDATHAEAQRLLKTLSDRRAMPQGVEAPSTASSTRPKRRPPPPAQTGSAALNDLVTTRPRPAERGDSEPRLPPTPLFSELPKKAFIDILVQLTMRRYAPGERVITQGEQGHSFFVLSSGRLRVEKSDPELGPVVLAYLTDGAFFGEMALLQSGPRTASVIVEEDSEILELDRTLLDSTVARYPSVGKVLRDFYKQRLVWTMVSTHPIFRPFTPSERRDLVGQFRSRAFLAKEVLIEEGGKGQGLYLLVSGRLEVSKGVDGEKVILAKLVPGDVFGEMSLLADRPTMATVMALEDSWVLRLAKNRFDEVVRGRPEVIALLSRLSDDRVGINRTVLEQRPAPTNNGDAAILL